MSNIVLFSPNASPQIGSRTAAQNDFEWVKSELDRTTMFRTIEILRRIGDHLARSAKDDDDCASRAKLIDISVQWHFLTGQIERLYELAQEIHAD